MRFQYHIKSNQMFQILNISMELPSHAADWGIISMGLSIFLSKYYSIVVKRRILIHPVRFRNSKIKKLLFWTKNSLSIPFSQYANYSRLSRLMSFPGRPSSSWLKSAPDKQPAGWTSIVEVSCKWTSSWLEYKLYCITKIMNGMGYVSGFCILMR